MEQNEKRWMGSRSKSYPKHNDYQVKVKETRLLLAIRNLHFTEPISLRTAVYVTRTHFFKEKVVV